MCLALAKSGYRHVSAHFVRYACASPRFSPMLPQTERKTGTAIPFQLCEMGGCTALSAVIYGAVCVRFSAEAYAAKVQDVYGWLLGGD
jgi:hypothetical protein